MSQSDDMAARQGLGRYQGEFREQFKPAGYELCCPFPGCSAVYTGTDRPETQLRAREWMDAHIDSTHPYAQGRPVVETTRKYRDRPLAELRRHRATFIAYLRERIEDEDWHGCSDAANDLRELDVEIRMTEARQ